MKNYFEQPLFIFEMANNHMGNLEHGLNMIRAFADAARPFNFQFAFKFQFRNLDTFIHPDFKSRMDLKNVKRFSETRLTKEQFQQLKTALNRNGFISICTPFDEPSVDRIEEMAFRHHQNRQLLLYGLASSGADRTNRQTDHRFHSGSHP